MSQRSLSWEQVQEIRGLLAEGDATQTAIGERFGVSPAVIWGIARGRNYRTSPPRDSTPDGQSVVRCRVCGEYKSEDEMCHASPAMKRRSQYEVVTLCRRCHHEASRARAERNPNPWGQFTRIHLRAQRRLAREHVERFEQIFAEELKKASAEQRVGERRTVATYGIYVPVSCSEGAQEGFLTASHRASHAEGANT